MESLGKAIVGVGVILIIVGLVIWFLGGRFGLSGFSVVDLVGLAASPAT
jgi:hypothetical protein